MPSKLTKETNAIGADGAIDPKVQEAILSDPRVQEAMKKSGEQALNNPAVQDAIFKVAKDNLTAENAAKIANSCKQWAQDPEVQAKARHYAGMAMAGAGQVGQQIIGCIEQGPDGIRYMCFVGSIVSTCLAGYGTFKCAFPTTPPPHFLFILNGVSQMFFAISSALFEAKPEQIQKFGLTKYQDMLIEYAKFITTAMGRGLFYIYQGMLWFITVGADKVENWFAPDVFFINLINIGMGVFFLVMGGFHIAMHYDIAPQEVVVKAKEMGGAAVAKARGAAGYEKVGQGP